MEAVSCLQGCQQVGMPECDVLLAQCAVRLARADKSTAVYRAMRRVQGSLAEGPLPPVPLHLRNAPTKLMKDLGMHSPLNVPLLGALSLMRGIWRIHHTYRVRVSGLHVSFEMLGFLRQF